MTAASLGHPSACHSFSTDFAAQQQHASPKMNAPPLYQRMRAAPDLSDDDDSVPPSPPVMPAATATSDVLAPPPPPECPNLSWQFIWSFFVRAPRVRAWLFDKNPPPLTHVAQALLSSPVLCGYVFGRVDRNVSQHCFPDIGDMHTTFCRDGETLLGFHFGFNGIQPILPMLFSVARDPMLGNPRVVVRRTALERVHLPGMPPCYLAIEFNWLESGSLSVVTNVHPIDKDPSNPTGMAAYFDHAEYRVFDRFAADRLKSIASRLDAGVVTAYFPSPDHFRAPPPEFLDPSDDYISLTIEEPNDHVYYSCLSPANVAHHARTARRGGASSGTNSAPGTGADVHVDTSQHESLRKSLDIQAELSKGRGDKSLFSAIAGATLHADCGESPSIAEEGTIVRWKAFQDLVAVARRTGMLKTRVGRKVGGLFAKVETLYSRTAGYTFLSTSGVSVHGRIQRLCDQLGIQVSSPDVDAPLNRAAAVHGPTVWTGGAPDAASGVRTGDATADATEDAEHGAAPTTPPVCEVDISNRQIEDLLLCGLSGVSATPPVQVATKAEPVPEGIDATNGPKRFAYSVSTARDQAVPSLGGVRVRGVGGEDGRPAKRPRVEPGFKVEGSSSGSAADGASSATHATGATHSTRPVSPSMRSEGTVVGKGNKAVWTCEQCGVKIRGKKGNLNRHIANKHDNIRAYLCNYNACGRRFQTRLNLVRHERAVHEGRPFVCPHCPRAFKVQPDLDGHVASAHANATVQLACDVCGSCFARRSTLNRHKIRVHKLPP